MEEIIRKEVKYEQDIDGIYKNKKDIPQDWKKMRTSFIGGINLGLNMVEYLDRKYEEIMNDISTLFKRR